MLLVVALVIFVYFGGKYVPSVLRQNKEMLLGIVIGLVLCSFMGMRLEGFNLNDNEEAIQFQNDCCPPIEETRDSCADTSASQALKTALCQTKPGRNQNQNSGSATSGTIGQQTASTLMGQGGVSSLLAGLGNTKFADLPASEVCSMDRNGLIPSERSVYDMMCSGN